MTEVVFRFMKSMMFEQDWKLFALLITIQRLSSTQAFVADELNIFVNGVTNVKVTPVPKGKEKPGWLDHEVMCRVPVEGIAVFYCTCTVSYCTAVITIVLYCTTVLCIVLYFTTVLCIVLFCTTVLCIVLFCTTVLCIVLYCTNVLCNVLYCTTVLCIVLYFIV